LSYRFTVDVAHGHVYVHGFLRDSGRGGERYGRAVNRQVGQVFEHLDLRGQHVVLVILHHLVQSVRGDDDAVGSSGGVVAQPDEAQVPGLARQQVRHRDGAKFGYVDPYRIDHGDHERAGGGQTVVDDLEVERDLISLVDDHRVGGEVEQLHVRQVKLQILQDEQHVHGLVLLADHRKRVEPGVDRAGHEVHRAGVRVINADVVAGYGIGVVDPVGVYDIGQNRDRNMSSYVGDLEAGSVPSKIIEHTLRGHGALHTVIYVGGRESVQRLGGVDGGPHDRQVVAVDHGGVDPAVDVDRGVDRCDQLKVTDPRLGVGCVGVVQIDIERAHPIH